MTTMTVEARVQGIQDLAIIKAAVAASPDRAFAVTQLADQVLHEQMAEADIVERRADGTVVVHDADAWGTPEYAAAWRNTRAAFHAAGIMLQEDPAATCARGRAGALCLVEVRRAA